MLKQLFKKLQKIPISIEIKHFEMAKKLKTLKK